MSDFDDHRSASLTLRSRSAGQTVMLRVLELQDEAPPRGRLARALGHSPLHPDAVAPYEGALDELETGRRLAALGTGYTVLHSLPIADADGVISSAIDHLVIGPSGVFCLLSTRSVTPAQQETVAAEARQVSRHLSRTLQRVVPVTPLIVTPGAAPAKSSFSPDSDIEVIPSRSLAAWFTRRGPVLTTAELATLALAAEQPDTWSAPKSLLERAMPTNDFHQLRSAVDAATDRERTALVVAVVVAVIILIVSASVVVKSLFPGFFSH
jgi:Nuclease-related domain